MDKVKDYLKQMEECEKHDPEVAHIKADELLCKIIEDELGEKYKELINKFWDIEKWYA